MKAEDNAFPSVLFAEGATPATPAAGKQRLFFDTADGLLKSVDDTGTVTSLAYTDEQARDAIGTALVAGSNVTITVNDAANTITIASSGSGSAELLASVSYNPATVVTLNPGTTEIDLDTTNLAIPFTVPASGRVLVVLTATAYTDTTSVVQQWLVRDGGTAVAGSRAAVNSQGARLERFSHRFIISGLTPSASKTWTWAAKTTTGTGHVRIGDDGTANTGGPAVMEVWSA